MKTSNSQRQVSKQIQGQFQKLSFSQIQALSFLSMTNTELNEAIHKAVSENPALEIVREPTGNSYSDYVRSSGSFDSDKNQAAIENHESHRESLQAHLMHQLNIMNVSEAEYNLCHRLIYNLDKNGFYGSMLDPETFLSKKDDAGKKLLERCLDIVHSMDPVGVCCKTPEESLFIQAKLSENAPEIALFLLNGHLDMVNPPEPQKILKKLIEYRTNWHKKAFAAEILLDKVELDEEKVSQALKFILSLDPHPAHGYSVDSFTDPVIPDIVLKIEKVDGYLPSDDYSSGLVSCDRECHFQVKYASGNLPEIRLAKDFKVDKENYNKAQLFMYNLGYRESTNVLQGCILVHEQKDFFKNGPGHLKPLTRQKVAQKLGVHQSTVSRMSSKNSSKYISTQWGLFPVSYFYPSGVESASGEKVSSEVIKTRINQILQENKNSVISDSKMAGLLNAEGIKISRRTVAKYRIQAGIKNSYFR